APTAYCAHHRAREAAMHPQHPYHPIIYVRGFAMLQSEIEETCADPYMGFNIGSTKSRMLWDGKLKKYFFESPVVRLAREGPGYDDVYLDGDDLVMAESSQQPVPYRSIIIYRYYDEASEAFGTGDTPPIEHFARGLNDLILRLRDKVCANPENDITPKQFRVYLVAHSMGGLVCRAFLQNPKLGKAEPAARWTSSTPTPRRTTASTCASSATCRPGRVS